MDYLLSSTENPMEALATYNTPEEEEPNTITTADALLEQPQQLSPTPTPTPTDEPTSDTLPTANTNGDHQVFDEMSEGDVSEDDEEEDDETPKKQKPLSSLIPQTPKEEDLVSETMEATPATVGSKKRKKKTTNDVWTKTNSRKGKKKGKWSINLVAPREDNVLITPVARFPDRSDDSIDLSICLSKVYKAETVELSEDRLSAASCKGYRMVKATRGVVEGAWYFEIKVEKLGETGHTRLGWATEMSDLQAPVGYDGNSFGYRDIDGTKLHKALREEYGNGGYVEGDVIGFYINLPDGAQYAPKAPHYVWYKGQKYTCSTDGKEELPKVVSGSEISFFRNGVCQGVAFKDLHGGRYYPAASMYTLPNQPNCVVKFNFGPDFECFPQDFECRPLPIPMIEVPYHAFDVPVEDGVCDEKKS